MWEKITYDEPEHYAQHPIRRHVNVLDVATANRGQSSIDQESRMRIAGYRQYLVLVDQRDIGVHLW